MVANHIHDALRQVQELKDKILEKQRFKGYSGRARAISGTLALVAAVVLMFGPAPHTVSAALTCWAVVFLLSALLNFGAIAYWFLFDPQAGRNPRRLKPVTDLLPPLIVGGILTLVLLLRGSYDDLFGTWMCLYGLAHLAGRHALPRRIAWIGLYYIVTGSVLLLFVPHSFSYPLLMGAVFFAGEWVGGIILHYDESEQLPLPHFLSKESYHAQTRESL